MTSDRRLIEDYLPIQAISAEASREKSVRKGHISTLHLWWARRPLVACRAAVYGALVPASRFIPENGPDNKKQSLGRANAAKFVERLCKYPGDPEVISQAQDHILEAHAERLTEELQADARPAWCEEFGFADDAVTVADIREGRAPRPRVLDMFAGGGSIPLEALRLGCEAYALDLNPVAHIIELCTLVYPQKYGKPEPNVRGMTGPTNAAGETTWGGLAEEVRWWGNWVLERVRREIGDLYPPVPDPDYPGTPPDIEFDRETGYWVAKGVVAAPDQKRLLGKENMSRVPPGCLVPLSYLWTRTVTCKNPACGAAVPLVKQTWLRKKADRNVALRVVAPTGRRVHFEVVEAATESGLGFDPSLGSTGGNATCPFCGTVADSDYVKAEGCAKRIGEQMMAIVCTRPGKPGRVYVAASAMPHQAFDTSAVRGRSAELCTGTGLTAPDEEISPLRPSPNARGLSATTRHGVSTFGDLFNARQMLSLLSLSAGVRAAHVETARLAADERRAAAVATYLGLLVTRVAHYNSAFCTWHNTRELIGPTFARQALAMVWDYPELVALGDAPGGPVGALAWIVDFIATEASSGAASVTQRGSALDLPWAQGTFDAVITDPPYYDNVPYADISDFFYVWLKRSIGSVHVEHFGGQLTPKKAEATALSARHSGDMKLATVEYETMMARAFSEASRTLKPDGQMTVVYAHKTTLGWATLVEAMRTAGFVVTEAWPLDTEMKARVLARDASALASSIFLVARKRTDQGIGAYETVVRPELEQIVRDRVRALWDMGITGADLVIAAVGAGLRAFTRFGSVEYANGEEVPAEKFLAEVEGVVLDTLMERIFGVPRSGVAAVDGPSRFYVLWRYTYSAAEMDGGEAIVFTYSQDVELDGQNGLSAGARSLVEKKKGKYRLKDFAERGKEEKLGLPDDGEPAPLVDVLHRILWLIENHPRDLNAFLDEARPDTERLRLVAQALAGAGLQGGDSTQPLVTTTAGEQSALRKLLANWRNLIEQRIGTPEAPRLGL